MDSAGLVTVYYFSVHELGHDRPVVPAFKASRDRIRDVFKGEVLEGTGEEVQPSELDSHGRYRRVATGWGDLPSS